jgi:hypothetical protein
MAWIATCLVCGAAVVGGGHPAHVECTAPDRAVAVERRDSHPGAPLVGGLPAGAGTAAIGFHPTLPYSPVDPARPDRYRVWRPG